MTVYIDADACPVKAEAERVATRHGVRMLVVSNGGIRPSANPLVESVFVAAGPDEADKWIAERAGPGDVVVTGDIPLAAKCVAAGARVLKHDGTELTGANIGNVLAGNYQWSSWGFPTLDNDPGLFNAARSGLPTNYSKYSNAEVDKALDAARLTTDLTARGAAYKTVYEALARDLPWFPYTITTNGYMFKGNVRGGVMYEDGIPRVDLLWVKK